MSKVKEIFNKIPEEKKRMGIRRRWEVAILPIILRRKR